MTTTTFPKPPADKKALEEGSVFSPRFDANGLVTAVVTDAGDGMLLMVAHMNAEALALTIETGIAHYWSRSRGSSGRRARRPAICSRSSRCAPIATRMPSGCSVKVAGHDATCHTGRRSCFYRTVGLVDGKIALAGDGSEPLFDAEKTYRS